MNEQVNSVYQVDSCRTRHDHYPRQKERTTVLCAQIENRLDTSTGSHFSHANVYLGQPVKKEESRNQSQSRQCHDANIQDFKRFLLFELAKNRNKIKSFERLYPMFK